MDVLGHDHVSKKGEIIAVANVSQDAEKNIAAPFGSEERETPVATARDEVQVTPTVAAFEAVLHRWIRSAAALCSARLMLEREIHVGNTTDPNPAAFAKPAKTAAPRMSGWRK